MAAVNYEENDGVGVLTLNRPDARNAFDGPMMDALAVCVDDLMGRTDVTALILTASGNVSFCAGGDLHWLKNLSSPEDGQAMGRRMQMTLDRLSRLPCPVIGVLNGYAIGGGAELALACDFRIMETHSFLHFKQVRVGLTTGWGGGPRLLRMLGYAKASELLMTCPKIDPEKALQLGLCTMKAASGEGLDAAWSVIRDLKQGSLEAIQAVKRLLQGMDGLNQDQGMLMENTLFRTVWNAHDHREAQCAFVDKRRAQFGRHRMSTGDT